MYVFRGLCQIISSAFVCGHTLCISIIVSNQEKCFCMSADVVSCLQNVCLSGHILKQNDGILVSCFHVMRGSRGGVRGVRTPPPWNLQSLISPILLEMKKLVIFHICALPQLYVKQNQSYLRLDPPWKNFLDPRLHVISLEDPISSSVSTLYI